MTERQLQQEPEPAQTRNPQRWVALTGVGAGLLGAAATLLSGLDISAADRRADPIAATVEGFDGASIQLRAAAALGLLAAALLVVFAAHLRRSLDGPATSTSILPRIAWAGGLITAASLATAFLFTAAAGTLVADAYRDSTLEVFAAITSKLTYAAWVPLGLTMAVLSLQSAPGRPVARWLGVSSAIAVLALFTAVLIGLPFASWVIAALWLVVAGTGMALGEPPQSSTRQVEASGQHISTGG